MCFECDWRLLEQRRLPSHGCPHQVARLHRIEGATPMQGGPVVPNQEVMGFPRVGVDMLRLSRKSHQAIEQRTSCIRRHAFNRLNMRTDV